MSGQAAIYNIFINKNSTYSLVATYTSAPVGMETVGPAIDITNCSFLLQIRPTPSASNVLFEASTANGAITILNPPTNGQFQIVFTDTQTYNMEFTDGVYDLIIKLANGTVARIFQGSVMVNDGVSVFPSTIGEVLPNGVGLGN